MLNDQEWGIWGCADDETAYDAMSESMRDVCEARRGEPDGRSASWLPDIVEIV